MKKLVFGLTLVACFLGLSAPSLARTVPGCRWVATVGYIHNLCGYQETHPWGYDLETCEYKVDNLMTVILVQDPYSDPVLVVGCHEDCGGEPDEGPPPADL